MERSEHENPGSGGTEDDAPAPFASPDEDPKPVEEATAAHETPATGNEPSGTTAAGVAGVDPEPDAPITEPGPVATEPVAAAPDPDDEPVRTAPAGPSSTFSASSSAPAGPGDDGGSVVQDKPELPVIGAFAGGLVLAILLRRLGS